MKKVVLFLMIFVIFKTQAQSYKIGFSGTGASNKVDSVLVENLTKGTSIMLKGSDTLNLTIITGIDNFDSRKVNCLQVRPNPMIDFCLIDFEAIESGMTNIELFDIAGKRIVQYQQLLNKGKNSFSLSGINSGIYFIKVKSNTYSYSAKIIAFNRSIVSGNAEIKHETQESSIKTQEIFLNNRAEKSFKSNKSVEDMPYSAGDVLKFTGYSGEFIISNINVVTNDQPVNFKFVSCKDSDNKNYPLIEIGSQVWMAQNLNVGTLTDGSIGQTDNGTIEKYCNNNDVNMCNIYGGLYQWNEMMNYKTGAVSQGICPAGWHIPTNAEWSTLFAFIGGVQNAGGKMKEKGTAHWYSPNTSASNLSGFNGLPGGYRDNTANFFTVGMIGAWWSASDLGSTSAWNNRLTYNGANVVTQDDGKESGFSVRCLKD